MVIAKVQLSLGPAVVMATERWSISFSAALVCCVG